MKAALNFLYGDTVLDVGCGAGSLLKHLPGLRQYLGMDIDSKRVFEAERLHPNHRFMWLNLNNTKEIPGFYDTIFMLAIVEHLDNPAKLIKLLARYLSPCGVIIITTPSPIAERILSWGSKLHIFNKEQIAQHKGLYSLTELAAMAKCANLKVAYYSTFELGLNQLIVFRKGESFSSDARGGLTSPFFVLP